MTSPPTSSSSTAARSRRPAVATAPIRAWSWWNDGARFSLQEAMPMTQAMPVASFGSFVQNFALTWLPVMFFGLMVVVVVLLWRTVKLMPRVKPTELTPGSSPSVTWSEVAGLDEAKEELQEIVDFLRDPGRFEKLGARVPKGILFHGPPGTGKTLAAKAVANESGARFYAQSASAFVEMFAGLGAARIRKLFDEARKNAPSIVFIDELDAVGQARSGGRSPGCNSAVPSPRRRSASSPTTKAATRSSHTSSGTSPRRRRSSRAAPRSGTCCTSPRRSGTSRRGRSCSTGW